MDKIYLDTDTDEKNSPNIIYLVPFFIRIRNADTDKETWNRGLTHYRFLLQCREQALKLISHSTIYHLLIKSSVVTEVVVCL